MTSAEAENVKTRRPLANDLARDALSWSPEWPLEQGIGQYVNAFRDFISSDSQNR
jgi:nucleoside-diphosphate-sugar epimerase